MVGGDGGRIWGATDGCGDTCCRGVELRERAVFGGWCRVSIVMVFSLGLWNGGIGRGKRLVPCCSPAFVMVVARVVVTGLLLDLGRC